MAVNLIGILVLLLVLALFIWLFRRAWRSPRPAVRWLGAFFSGLLALVAGLLAVLAAIGFVKVYYPPAEPVADVQVAGTPEQISRGEHLASILCVDCHSQNGQLPLSGGKDIADEIPFPMGSFTPNNLTPGGRIEKWSDGELFRALRSGIFPTGRKMLFMSALGVHNLGDEDIHSVIAFLRSQQPVSGSVELERVNLLGLIMAGGGMIPSSAPVQGPVTAPPVGPTAEYGNYLVGFMGCRDCHGENLQGGSGALAPQGPNLVAVVPHWAGKDFVKTLRTGVTPSGETLDPNEMPWKTFANLDDVELQAIYQYIRGLGGQ